MAHEPKKRHSKQRQGKRRSAIKLEAASLTVCSNCKAPIRSHMICNVCGYYKGKQVLARV